MISFVLYKTGCVYYGSEQLGTEVLARFLFGSVCGEYMYFRLKRKKKSEWFNKKD
jgi:hypothetical protein